MTYTRVHIPSRSSDDRVLPKLRQTLEELYAHAANALHTAAENFKQQVSEKGAIDDWQPMQVCTIFYTNFIFNPIARSTMYTVQCILIVIFIDVQNCAILFVKALSHLQFFSCCTIEQHS